MSVPDVFADTTLDGVRTLRLLRIRREQASNPLLSIPGTRRRSSTSAAFARKKRRRSSLAMQQKMMERMQKEKRQLVREDGRYARMVEHCWWLYRAIGFRHRRCYHQHLQSQSQSESQSQSQ